MGQQKCCPFFFGEGFMASDAVIESLEQVAEIGDPAPAVYKRLFAEFPELESLFVRDRDGAVRGHMFQEMIRALMDMRGNGLYGANLLQVERVNHEQLGVRPETYPAIFRILRDVMRDMLAASWTGQMEDAWNELLSLIDRLLAPQDGGQAAAGSRS